MSYDETVMVLERFTAAMRDVQKAFRVTAHKMALLSAGNKKLRRRIERDFARSSRRPALIHNGRKP